MNKFRLPFANGNHPRSAEEKSEIIERAALAYAAYMDALGFDWRSDPNSSETPMRVAKAFVNDLADGCYSVPPKITAFDNVDKYDGVVFQGNIKMHSFCSHHHLPFIGNAHVAYIPNGNIVGLSKIPRIVDVFARRLQVQERLTDEIKDCLQDTLNPIGVAVVIEAQHLCMQMRGVEKQHSSTTTSAFSGIFISDEKTRAEFMNLIK